MVSQAPNSKAVAPRNLGGRPPKLHADEATLKQLQGLGQIQATTKECAAVLGVHETTFIRFLNEHPEAREAMEMGAGTGRASLRRKQFALAERNAAMAIWLGKQYLDQKDRQEHVGADGGPIRFNLTNLTDEELEALERIRSRIAVDGGDPRGEIETGD